MFQPVNGHEERTELTLTADFALEISGIKTT
jgi:hypothetical protein